MTASSPGNDPRHALRVQLDGLVIDADRPLLISDADEVLFAFMAGFERHLKDNGARFTWASFQLDGNIVARNTDEPLDRPRVRLLLESFFDLHTGTLPVVAHAPEALRALSRRLQIVVLSNVPHPRREARAAALRNNGMPFPIVSNEGSKAEAVRGLAGRTRRPVFFVDDSPSHHAEVARAAGRVMRIHFIGDPRLSRLLGPAEDCHFRARDWPEIRRYIEAHLDRRGPAKPARDPATAGDAALTGNRRPSVR